MSIIYKSVIIILSYIHEILYGGKIMFTLDTLENHFYQYGIYYKFDISNLENVFDELREVII